MMVLGTARAQQIPAISQFYLQPFFVNPSYAGYSGFLELSALYKKQWSGIPGAPEDQMLSFSGFLPDQHLGIGLLLRNEVNNFLGNTSIAMAFSYHLTVAENHKIRFGISPKVSFHRIYFDRLTAEDPYESTILERTENASVFDGDFGMSYTFGGLNIGFAAQNIMQSNMIFQTEEKSRQLVISQIRHFNVTASYRVPVHPYWDLQPGIEVYSVQGLKSTVEGSVTGMYKDMLWAGVHYRAEAAAGMSLGVLVDNTLTFSYHYEYPVSAINKIAKDSHEILLTFRFGAKKAMEKEAEMLRAIDRLSAENKEQYALINSRFNDSDVSMSELIQQKMDSMKQVQDQQMEILMTDIRKASKDSVFIAQQVAEKLDAYRAQSNKNVQDLETMTLHADSLPHSFELLKDINELKKENEEQFALIRNLISVNDSLQNDVRLYNETVADLEGVIRAVQLSLEDSLSPVNLHSDYYEVIGAFKTFKYAKLFQRGVRRDHRISSTIVSQVRDKKEYFVVYAAKTEALETVLLEIEQYKRKMLLYEIHGFEE